MNIPSGSVLRRVSGYLALLSIGLQIHAASLLNVDFGAHLNPFFRVKQGPAAVGQGPEDLWNLYSRDIDSAVNWRADGEMINLVWADGSASPVDLSVTNAAGAWGTGSVDAMFDSYLYPQNGGPMTVTLREVPTGVYDLYFYAHGQIDGENGVVSLSSAGTDYGTKSTIAGPGWNPLLWTEGSQYVLFAGVQIAAGQPVTITLSPGSTGLAVMNGLQLFLNTDLSVSPWTELAFRGHPGGPYTPPSGVYQLANSGAEPLAWSVNSNEAWVTVEPAAGSLAAGATTAVTASLTAAAVELPVGMHSAQLSFQSSEASGSQVRTVLLEVFTDPQLVVAPTRLDVATIPGGSVTRTLLLSNATAADGALDFSLTLQETARSEIEVGASVVAASTGALDQRMRIAKAPHRPQELLVRFASQLTASERGQVAGRMGLLEARRFRVVPGLVKMKVPPARDLEQVLAELKKTPGVLYAEPNYQLEGYATPTPNDPIYANGLLWGLTNYGQDGGVAGADIQAPDAWAISLGAAEIIVAVLDTGLDHAHPDLSANAWTNPGEIPGNGLDDDHNGKVDDVHGYDFINDDGDPMDDHGHGTHVAGTIGAVGNNGTGSVGVCWQVQILGVKTLAANGQGTVDEAIAGIEYALEAGARVINASWGGSGSSQALQNAIDAAGALKVVFVAAAGNSGTDNDASPQYPASYPSSNLIAVMATDRTDQRPSFSNYGAASVDLGAPGDEIASTIPGNTYAWSSGTSMATPHVSGACALLLSVNPDLTGEQLRSILMGTVDLTSPPLVCVSGGRLNVARALGQAAATWLTVDTPSASGIAPGGSNAVTVTFSAASLALGRYEGEIVISSNDRERPTVLIPVVLTVAPTAAYVFYNNSAWDGNDPNANPNDDNAIAPDKVPLRPGSAANFTHYSNYSRGLNGVMIDLANTAGTISADDFALRVGNDSTPEAWPLAPSPAAISVRLGAGVNGSDRVTLTWVDRAIQKQWLQVTVLATPRTGLASPEIFYFGSAIGDTGDAPAPNNRVRVNTQDEARIRLNPRNLVNNPAPVWDPYDLNRDRRVNTSDEIVARLNPASFLDGLLLFSPP